MANNKSAIKRIRQNEKRRVKNSRVKASLRTAAKSVVSTLNKASDPQELADNFKNFVKRTDSAARKGVIHKRTAARRKSRLAKRINTAVIKTV